MPEFRFRGAWSGADDWETVRRFSPAAAAEAAAAELDARQNEYPAEREILIEGYGWWIVSAETRRVYAARGKG